MAETQYPDADAIALDGATNSDLGFVYPTANETYTTTGLRRLWQVLVQHLTAATNPLRVFKDGTNTFGVRAGAFFNNNTLVSYSEATGQSLTNDATNYIYLTAGGTLTKNTTGFPDPATTPHIPLATIAVGSASVAQVDDEYEHVDLVDYRKRSLYEVLGGSADRLTVRNASGLAMDKADLVYISGYNAGDDCPEVTLADADDPMKLATHVLLADIADGSTGDVAAYAVVVDDTSGLSVGDPLYLSATAGDWASSSPTGDAQTVQVIGVVQTVGASGTVVFTPGMATVDSFGVNVLPANVVDCIPDLNVTFGAEAADEITVTIQARDGADNSLAERLLVRVWVSTTDFGAADATGNTVSVDTGTAMGVNDSANEYYEVISDASGTVEIGITVSGAATRYVMAELDGRVYSSGQIDWAA